MSEAAVAVEETAPTLVQKLLAEAIGTFVLVFLGCGSVVMFGNVGHLGGQTGLAGVVNIGLSFGIAIVAMVYAFGRISGGHFNPAVSVGAALAGRIAWKESGLYIAAQVVGGLIGGLALAITSAALKLGWHWGDPLGSNQFGEETAGNATWYGAFLLELILTFVFVMVIVATTDRRNKATAAIAPLAIGLTLAAIHFVAIPVTGTSVNPARSIGVAFFSGGDAIKDLWLFIVAPLIGGAIAGVLYPLVFGKDADPVPGSGLSLGTGFGTGGSSNPAFTQQWNQQSAGQVQQQQPIIQDGWQWDPNAQQWIPAQQQPAQQAQQAQPQSQQGQATQQFPTQDPQQGCWGPPDGGSEHTIVRPPQ